MTRVWILGIALLAAACSSSDSATDAVEPVALVKLAPVSKGAAGETIAIYGAAEPGPGGKISLVAPAEAKVVAIVAPAGTTVMQGQVIVRLSPSSTTSADAAKAMGDAVAADKALARAVRMRGDGLMSDADVEAARAAAAAADAVHASFNDKSRNLTLRAPGGGIVDSIAVAVGDVLQSGAAVASISRSTEMRARFGVDPDTARAMHPGTPLRIGRGDRAPVETSVQSASAVIDSQTKMASIFARIPATSGIAPGEALSAAVDIGAQGTGLSIPYNALLDDAGQPYVFVVAGGVAHRRDVTTGVASGDRVTVFKGLKPGEQLIVEGGTAVEDGMRVRTR